MSSSKQTTSPLRQRMLDDMRMRKLSDKTQTAYIRAVRRFTLFLGRSPDNATVEELRRFQLYLVDQGTSPVTLNATITGLKFFFDVTLDRGELMVKMQPVHVPRALPIALSREEVARLIAAAGNIRVTQVMLGHKKLETTALYTQVATDILREVVNPLENLPTE